MLRCSFTLCLFFGGSLAFCRPFCAGKDTLLFTLSGLKATLLALLNNEKVLPAAKLHIDRHSQDAQQRNTCPVIYLEMFGQHFQIVFKLQ